MGLFDLFKKDTQKTQIQPQEQIKTFATTLTTGSYPIYTDDYIHDILQSEVGIQIINLAAGEIMKTTPLHIQRIGSEVKVIDSPINHVLANPNKAMTTADFLQRITFDYFRRSNVYIYPQYDGEKLVSLTPIYPIDRRFYEMPDGELYVELFFSDGQKLFINHKNIIHARWRFYDGYEGSQINLSKPLQLNEKLLENVTKASGSTITGILKYTGTYDKKVIDENVRIFNEGLAANKNTILPIDGKSEYMPITHQVQMVDVETLKYSYEQVLHGFKTSLAMLNGDVTAQQKRSYYDIVIEPVLKSYKDAFSKVLLTDKQRQDGHEIVFQITDGSLMSHEEKIETVSTMMAAGLLAANEIRVLLGFAPMKELEGHIPISLNWANLNDLIKNPKTEGNDNE